MQGSIESGQDPWSPKCPRHLDGRPGGGGRKPTGDVLQRRTHSLVDYQPGRRPQPHSRIENVDGICVLEIEAVQSGGCAHACDGALPHEHVESTESADEIWLRGGIDAVPDADQAAVLDERTQLIARHHGEQILGGRESA